jgi:NADH-quinone oxidoreductase subunit L
VIESVGSAPLGSAARALVVLVIAAPFLAALLGLLVGRVRPRLVVPVALAGTGISLAGAVVALFLDSGTASLGSAPTGTVPIGLDLQVDGLGACVAVAVTVVALLVQVYSVAYLRDADGARDPRYASYAAFISLFTAAMLLVVFADDLFVLLVGWEVMGACSYFLIGHHWERPEARPAAIKAFLTTRVGDVGFMFGIFALGLAAGTFRISGVVEAVAAGELSTTEVTVATLLLLCGVVGKSAQFPLHTWLPDAMAGPTPISALIHAATMVAAGIYLVARLYDVFLAAPTTLAVMAVIAALTMLGAALAALAQDDIKRVLAYSTVSQLAYMLGGLAVGSSTAAGFHLLTHAAFKALLFLAAGAVIHAVGSNLLGDMGGLRKAMPVTFVTMTLGLSALAGVPPLSGFFSKEAVLGAAEHAALHSGSGEAGGPVEAWTGWLVLVVGLLTVAVTAAYTMRLWLMVFVGPPRSPRVPHEAPGLMRWPLVVLAVPTVLLGLLAVDAGLVSRLLFGGRGLDLPVYVELADGSLVPPGAQELHLGALTSVLSVALAVTGAVLTYLAWRRVHMANPAEALGWLRPSLARAFYVDELYDATLVRPTRALARWVVTGDRDVVDAWVRGSGTGSRWLGAALRLTQTGNVQTYLTVLLAGAVLALVGAVVVT